MQEKFKINVAHQTSEELGRYILEELETGEAWVVPIYPDKTVEPAGEPKIKLVQVEMNKTVQDYDGYYQSWREGANAQWKLDYTEANRQLAKIRAKDQKSFEVELLVKNTEINTLQNTIMECKVEHEQAIKSIFESIEDIYEQFNDDVDVQILDNKIEVLKSKYGEKK
jgi:hypothetical protein